MRAKLNNFCKGKRIKASDGRGGKELKVFEEYTPLFDPGRFVANPDNINMTLTSANLSITILTVSQSATQL